jgi:outer membrane protein
MTFAGITIIGLLALSPTPQDQPGPLTLAEALRLAARGPSVEAADSATDAAAARMREARAALGPQVSVIAQGRGLAARPGMTVPPGLFGMTPFDFVTGDRMTGAFGVEVEQLLWDSGRISAYAKAAEGERNATKADATTRQRAVALATARSYSAAVAAQGHVEVLRRALAVADETLRVVTSMLGQEMLPRSDQLSTDYYREDIKARLAQAESDEVAARATLRALIGREPGPLVLPPPPTLDAAKADEAFRARSELLALEARRGSALQAAAGAAAERRPVVVAIGQAGYTHDNYLLNETNASAQIAVRVPILDGGRATAKSAAYRASARVAELSAEATRRQVAAELVSTAAAERAARQRLQAAERAVAASVEALRLEQLRHGQGLATTRELLQAMTDDTAAQSGLVAARASLTCAVAESATAGGTDLSAVFAKESR